MRGSASNNTGSLPNDRIREALRETADLILPYRCAVCGRLSDTEERFRNYDDLYLKIFGKESELHICGKCLSAFNTIEENRRWSLCLSNPIENDECPGLALFMPFNYRGIVERTIPKIKFGKQIELARLLGCLLGSGLLLEGIRADLVVPVPLSPERLAERGFNQAAQIAYPVAVLNGIPYAGDVLIKTKDTKRQSEINDNVLRSNNVTDAYSVSDSWDLTGMTVAVVDDVSTTGATLHEAAKALYRAGASKVLCVAFAGNRQNKNAEMF